MSNSTRSNASFDNEVNTICKPKSPNTPYIKLNRQKLFETFKTPSRNRPSL